MSARIAIVVGGKGGVGSTTLCVEFALASVKRKQTVALIDADLAARRSIAVLLDEVRTLDAARSSANIATATAQGMTLVEMTSTIDGAFTITPQDADFVATSVIELHEVVFVDAPQPYAAALRQLVTRAQLFVLVVEPSILGVTGARAAQLELAKFGIPASHIAYVINARDARPAVSRRTGAALRSHRRDTTGQRPALRQGHRDGPRRHQPDGSRHRLPFAVDDRPDR
jgi:MinD-like ATPase involved in chromosome partitioning or flagellar assembly